MVLLAGRICTRVAVPLSAPRSHARMVVLQAAPLLVPSTSLLAPSEAAPEVFSMLVEEVFSMLAEGGGFSSTADDLAGSLFGASLFPWLAMLYWLKHPLVQAPPGVSFGLPPEAAMLLVSSCLLV